jgi:cytoskeletal protein CcmA (bactofilin family)
MFQIRLFSLAVLLTSLVAFQIQAQWETTVTGTVNLSAPNSTRNVGIGTQNTQARAKLDVIGTTIFQGNSSIIGTSLVQGNATVTGTSRLNGKVGINGAPGVEMLEVGGNIRSKGHIFINPNFNLTTTGVYTNNATVTGTIYGNYLKSNNFMMPTGAGASKVLTSDELGNATWQPLPTQTPSQWTNNGDGTGISYDKKVLPKT